MKAAALRAFHTFWQSFSALLAVTWVASGLDVSQVTDWSSAKRFAFAALTAVGAAALAALRKTAPALITAVATWASGATGFTPEQITAALADADATLTPTAAPAPAAVVPAAPSV